jgi:hypothetical protein
MFFFQQTSSLSRQKNNGEVGTNIVLTDRRYKGKIIIFDSVYPNKNIPLANYQGIVRWVTKASSRG